MGDRLLNYEQLLHTSEAGYYDILMPFNDRQQNTFNNLYLVVEIDESNSRRFAITDGVSFSLELDGTNIKTENMTQEEYMVYLPQKLSEDYELVDGENLIQHMSLGEIIGRLGWAFFFRKTSLKVTKKASVPFGKTLTSIPEIEHYLSIQRKYDDETCLDPFEISHMIDVFAGEENPILDDALNGDILLTTPSTLELKTSHAGSVQLKFNSLDDYVATLSEQEQKRIRKLRIEYGIIRSWIDYPHDFLYIAILLQEDIITFLELIYPGPGFEMTPGFKSKLRAIYEKIKTKGGDVSQTACRSELEKYLIEYRIQLNIPFLPPTEFGNMGMANVYKNYDERKSKASLHDLLTDEFKEYLNQLKKDGITHIYVEAQNMSLAQIFIKYGFGLIVSVSSERDGGSGYSDRTALNDGLDPSLLIIVERQYDESMKEPFARIDIKTNSDGSTTYTIINGPNCKSCQYNGFMPNCKINAFKDGENSIKVAWKEPQADVEVGFTNDTLVEKVGTKRDNSDSYAKPFQLSLNALLELAQQKSGNPVFQQLRGEGTPKDLTSQFRSEPMIDDMVQVIRQRIGVLITLFKTNTDAEQLETLELLKGVVKCAVLTSDITCDISAAEYFNLMAIRVGVNKMSITCGDTRYETLNQEQIFSKFAVLKKIQLYNRLIKDAIARRIEHMQAFLKYKEERTLSASTFYAISQTRLSQQGYRENADKILDYVVSKAKGFNVLDINAQLTFLKQFPDELSEYIINLSSLKQSRLIFDTTFTNFHDIIQKIYDIQGRVEASKLSEIFDEIKRALVNSLPTDKDYTPHLMSLFVFVIGTKREHAKDNFITALTLLAEETETETDETLYRDIITLIKAFYNTNRKVTMMVREARTPQEARIKEIEEIEEIEDSFASQHVIEDHDDNEGESLKKSKLQQDYSSQLDYLSQQSVESVLSLKSEADGYDKVAQINASVTGSREETSRGDIMTYIPYEYCLNFVLESLKSRNIEQAMTHVQMRCTQLYFSGGKRKSIKNKIKKRKTNKKTKKSKHNKTIKKRMQNKKRKTKKLKNKLKNKSNKK
jgi:phosphoglycolate phosphatase-like HAD superfamily hydrolase